MSDPAIMLWDLASGYGLHECSSIKGHPGTVGLKIFLNHIIFDCRMQLTIKFKSEKDFSNRISLL